MKRVKTIRNNLKNFGRGSMTTHQEQGTITPIPSSGEEEYQTYNTYPNHNNHHNIHHNIQQHNIENGNIDSLSETQTEKQNQKELNNNLRILERQRGIEQLITSEEKYCNNLKKLITLYFEPLSNHLSSQNQFILFGDIKNIYEKNAQFSIALDQKYKTFNPAKTLIGDEILKYFNPNLRILYQNYVNRHEQASKLLLSLQTDSKFVRICEEAQSKRNNTRNGMSSDDMGGTATDNSEEDTITNHLRHLLLLPIHRISKYEAMIKDIINNTNEIHNDYNNLNVCLRDISGINQLISDKMKEFSEREVVRKIANAIKGSESLKLETPYRKFIKNGYLIKMGKTKPQRYLFFLFNDLLFYCKTLGHDSHVHGHENHSKDKENHNHKENHEREDSASKSEESKEDQPMKIDLRPANENTTTTTQSQSHSGSNLGVTSNVAHDYSDTSDLHQITSLFGDITKQRGKSRKSRTKLFSDPGSQSDGETDELSMTSFGMNVDIHNEIDVFNTKNIGQFKVHNLMPIDAAFQVSDFRIFPQRYEHKAFEIRSSVKSFIVVAESDRSKKEWMTLLEHCTNQLFQLSLKTNGLSLNLSNKSSNSMNKASKKSFSATLYLPTNFTEQCMKCAKQFGYSRRKNHCHHCGLLVCSKCLTEKLPSFQDSIKAPNNSNKSKHNTTFKVCDDCYTKNKHFFPEFEEASALSTNAKSKIFAYKQKSKRKQFKNKIKKGKKKGKFKIFKNKSNLTEDAENDDFYEKGSLKDGIIKNKENTFDGDHNNENNHDGSDDDETNSNSSDYEQLSENEPSMLSIPENDDHIETLIGHNDYEPSVSSHLAPHWTPHATASGHHNKDFSHNTLDNAFADDDSDSDKDAFVDIDKIGIITHNNSNSGNNLLSPKDQNKLSDDLTPPVSDADVPVSPYYDDTPLMNGKGSFEFDADELSPNNKSAHLELRPQNSLNIGNVLDELEREQQERRDEEDFADNDDEELDMMINKKPQQVNRQSSLLRAIPEYEDTDDDTSANDTDAQTAYEHMRNLSTHIEDQEYGINGNDSNAAAAASYEDIHTALQNRNSLKIHIQRNGSHDEPGNTPPPVSPRYRNKKITNEHKRKLSDKLDKFLNERSGPQQLIQKHILYTTPEEDIETLKEKIQIKRDERDKIKKRLKRKLSHDFRPTEQDIEDRGIKIVPEVSVLHSDEEDMDEEIIVYDGNDRNSFSVQKKKSYDKNKNRERKSQIDSGDYAVELQKERQRNSQKIKEALIERPTPSDIIEKGYISAQNVNSNIPPLGAGELLQRVKAELKLAIIDNKKYKIEKEKIKSRKKRRRKILSFYDTYLFNYIFDDEHNGENNRHNYPITEQYVDIDLDYQQILNYVPDDVPINSDEKSLEKEWMRNLRRRKFRTYINQNKCKILQTKRDGIENQLNELNQQIEVVENTEKIERMTNEIDRLTKQRIILVQNTSQEIQQLRDIIKNLNKLHCKLHAKKRSFISVT